MYTNLPISHGYIFRILQHFAPKLCHFTNFGMLFHAIVMNCTISNFLKIFSIMQSVHCDNTYQSHLTLAGCLKLGLPDGHCLESLGTILLQIL